MNLIKQVFLFKLFLLINKIYFRYLYCYKKWGINLRRKLNNGEYKNIKGSIMNKGYRYIQLIRNGKRKNLLFHLLYI